MTNKIFTLLALLQILIICTLIILDIDTIKAKLVTLLISTLLVVIGLIKILRKDKKLP